MKNGEIEMGWFNNKRIQKKELSENIQLMTDVFTEWHNTICDSLNNIFAKGGLWGEKIDLKIKDASKFEIGMYLLFRLDLRMSGQQQKDARRSLFESCMYSILPSHKDRFIDLVYHRLDIYEGIFNQTKNSGGDWAEYKLRCKDWLFNAILYSQNDYNKMNPEDMPLVLNGIGEHMIIEAAMVSVESTLFILFESALKHVFDSNNDFRLLTTQELIQRIKSGQEEGQSIIDRNK
jgi:hypothetical protein